MNFMFDLTITLSLVVTVFLAFASWVRVRNNAVNERIDDHGERLDRHEQRILSAEQTLKGMPGKDDIHALSLSITEMRGDMREMRTAMQGQGQIMTRLETVVSRQEDHLMRTRT